MEVDFLNGDVVDFGFAGTEQFEGVDGSMFDGGDEVCGVDQVADDGEGAAVGVCVCVGLGLIVRVSCFVLMLGFGVVLMGMAVLVVR